MSFRCDADCTEQREEDISTAALTTATGSEDAWLQDSAEDEMIPLESEHRGRQEDDSLDFQWQKEQQAHSASLCCISKPVAFEGTSLKSVLWTQKRFTFSSCADV